MDEGRQQEKETVVVSLGIQEDGEIFKHWSLILREKILKEKLMVYWGRGWGRNKKLSRSKRILYLSPYSRPSWDERKTSNV